MTVPERLCDKCVTPHACDREGRCLAPLTDQERFQRRYAGEWPVFQPPRQSPDRVVTLFSRTSEGTWRWRVKVGAWIGVGYAPSLLAALGQAQDAVRAVAA